MPDIRKKKVLSYTFLKNLLEKIIKENKNKTKVPPLGLESMTTQQQEVHPAPILASNIIHLGEMAGAETIQDELGQLVVPESKVVLKKHSRGLPWWCSA